MSEGTSAGDWSIEINVAFRVLLNCVSGAGNEITLDAEDILGSLKNKFYRVPFKEPR